MRPILHLLLLPVLAASASAQSVLQVPSGSYPTIKSAVNAAVDGDTVLVAPGTYAETLIYLNGKKITIRSTGGPDVTIVDAEGKNRAFRFNGGEDANTVLDGFTILNGQAPTGGGTIGDGGGAILIQNGSPWIRNCVFLSCRADDGTSRAASSGANGYRGGHGGALYLSNADARIESCRFQGNYAGRGGNGGSGAAGAQGSLFAPTGKPGGDGGDGGSGGHGGAIYLEATSFPTIVNCSFENNSPGRGGSAGPGGPGGPAYLDIVFGFTGKGGPGGDGGNGGRGGDGGAVYATSDSRATLIHCTLQDNLTGNGGSLGLGAPGGPGTSTGAAGSNGSSGAEGTGSAAVAADLSNSISWNNEDGDLVGSTATFSLVEGGFAGVGNLDLDPLLGGATSYALSPASPCIDAGDRSQLPAWVTTDIVGNPRALDDPLVPDTGFGGTPMVDLGAFEFADGYVLPLGCGVNPPGSLVVQGGEPHIGTVLSLALDNPLGTQAPGALPALLWSLLPPSSPCGVLLANFGMAGGGTPGALLVGADVDGVVGAPWAGTGNPAVFAAGLPNESSLIGVSIYTQGVLVGGGGVGLSNGIELLVGP